ncbi:MAG: S8 family serine peptidase [Candidatus Eiseniibacteriota bacterium]
MHVLLVAAVFAAAAETAFPTADLLPKSETGMTRFLEEHPTYDGRGVVVAIFDTGVDPGAPGLQVTTDGKPKIVDLVDGSGSGDVSTRTVRRADGGELVGPSGRTLDVGALSCPSGDFHLGVKPAFELWPVGLVTRMKERRKEQLDEAHGPLLAEARRALDAFDDEHPEPTESERMTREELAARVDVLRTLAGKAQDPGPVYDCVVFHDGEHWRAVIDTDEDGDLADEKAMANYRVAREWATFDEESLLNYAVNIYADGNLLSIVTDCGSHGTHVAGIVAAHHPENRALDGMAPGAQLVCVKIGDTRLGASSTNTGPVRGLITALADSCALINMSFGGSTPSPDEGHMIELYQEIVNEHGVVFVLSAGNNGPALSTVGSAGGTSSHLMGIGAYLSGSMMTAQYSIREKLPDTHYTWSSRGPTADGDLGVALSAPGGAFSPVPNWELKPTSLLNGTSMAAPSVCGGIACLLSGAKAEGLATSPHDIRRALESTAEQPEGFDPWTLGRGLARFDRAWEALRAHRPHAPHGVRFEVNVPARDGARGVHLREPEESSRAHDLLVEVAAVFADADSNRARISFERHLRLESSAPWVDAPGMFVVVPGTRSFKIKVDPRSLPPGVHFAEVRGTDTGDPGRGPLFRVPVTVIRSEKVPDADPSWQKTLAFEPGQIRRFFFAVPDGATWADLVIRTENPETPRQIVAHAVQLVPGSSYAEWNTEETQWLDQGGRYVKSFAVAGGRTLELCLAQNWSNLGPGEADFELTFHGLVPDEARVDVDGGTELSRPLLVRASLRPETLAPKAEAKVLRKTLLPEEAEVRALDGSRDLLPQGRQVWEALLTYEFELDDDAKVRPRAAVLESDEIWQSWQSMLWQIHDEGKRLAANGPKDAPVSLGKGKYTLRFHVRSTDEAALRGLRNMPLALDRTLDDAVALRVLNDPDGALEGGHDVGETKLARGQTAAMWIAPPPAKSIPKGAAPGDLLVGTLRFGPEGSEAAAAGDRPSGWPLTVRLASARVEDESTEADGVPEAVEASTADELAEELLQVEVDHLAKLRKDGRDEDFEAQSRVLLKERGRTLPLLVERMRYLAEKEEPDAKAVVKACDEVVDAAAGADLAELLGERADPENEEAKAAREGAEKRRDALVEALRRKVEALVGNAGADAEIAAAYAEVARWTDPAKGEAAVVAVEHERRRGRPAKALEVLNARIDEAAPDRTLFEQRLRLLETLGWTSWVEREKRLLVVRFPESYPPF